MYVSLDGQLSSFINSQIQKFNYYNGEDCDPTQNLYNIKKKRFWHVELWNWGYVFQKPRWQACSVNKSNVFISHAAVYLKEFKYILQKRGVSDDIYLHLYLYNTFS